MPCSASLFIARKTHQHTHLCGAFLGAILERAVSENVNRSTQGNNYYQNKLSATLNKKGHREDYQFITSTLTPPTLKQQCQLFFWLLYIETSRRILGNIFYFQIFAALFTQHTYTLNLFRSFSEFSQKSHRRL